MNWFAHPHFAEPRWLWFAVLGPLALVALQRYSGWQRGRQLARIAAPGLLGALTASHSPARQVIKNVLLALAVAAFGLALARPQWGEHEDAGQLLGQDVVFMIDCSRSMLATDVSPNRLQRCKMAVLEYVQHHGRGRVGLVAFAGQAFLQCPLTYDYSAFQDTLAMLDEHTIPVLGTDIGRALDEGFRAMDKSERVKLMVLMTDGEDLEKSGVRVAEKLAKDGVVIYTVGVGTAAGSEIQILNEQGRPEVLRDRKGEIVRSRLDETILRGVAKVTHGDYFPLGPVGEGLAKVRLAAEGLTGSSGSAPGKKLGVDRFHYPIAAALVLLVGESLLGTRRRKSA